MPHRLLGYLVRIWEDWRRKNPTATKLPVVIPLVLHQGPKPWNAARSMDDLYDSTRALLARAGAVVPRLELALLDLGERTPVGAAELRGPVLMRLTLALLRAMADPAPDAFAAFKALGHLIRELLLQAGGPRDVEELVEYVLLVMQELDAEALGRVVAEAAGQGAGEAVMTAAEKLRNEGRAKSLLQQLEELFAPLSDDTRARVEGASTEDLDAWSRAVLRAKRLEDVFNPRPKPSPRQASRRGKGSPKKKR